MSAETGVQPVSQGIAVCGCWEVRWSSGQTERWFCERHVQPARSRRDSRPVALWEAEA